MKWIIVNNAMLNVKSKDGRNHTNERLHFFTENCAIKYMAITIMDLCVKVRTENIARRHAQDDEAEKVEKPDNLRDFNKMAMNATIFSSKYACKYITKQHCLESDQSHRNQ